MSSGFVFGLERALNARPSAGHIQTRYLRGFNSLVCNMGVDPLEAIQQPLLHGYMLMLKTLRMLGGSHFSPLYLQVAFEPGRRGAQALEKAAGCRIVRAPVNAIVLASENLDRPMASSNNLIYELLGGYFARVRQAAAPTLREQIEAYVGSALKSGSCSVGHCAARLGLSSRSLQKRLTELDLSFSHVVEEQRVTLAKQALRQSEATLDEIAMSLGYSDQTCFGRAFRRWTGLTPQTWRGSDGR